MKNQSKHKIDNQRRLGKHVASIVEFVESIGGSDIDVSVSKHLRLAFTYQGERLHIGMASSPKTIDMEIQIARGKVRAAIRKAGLEAPGK